MQHIDFLPFKWRYSCINSELPPCPMPEASAANEHDDVVVCHDSVLDPEAFEATKVCDRRHSISCHASARDFKVPELVLVPESSSKLRPAELVNGKNKLLEIAVWQREDLQAGRAAACWQARAS